MPSKQRFRRDKKHPGSRRPAIERRGKPAAAKPPTAAQLASYFDRCDLTLRPAQIDAFWRFHQLLRQRNEELDLTRLHNFENMVLKLYVDSAIVTKIHDLPSPLLDLGTGAGFPGIPIKILRPDLDLILAEPRRKRVHFLHEVIDELKLDGIEVVPKRVGEDFALPVQGVITRAVESIGRTLRRTRAWLPPGCQMILMKGPDVDDELDEALSEYGRDFELSRNHAYKLGRTSHERRLIVLRRSASTVASRAPRPSRDTSLESPRTPATVEAASFETPTLPPGGTPFDTRSIASKSNSTFKMLKSLNTSRGIRKHGCALVSGMRHVQDILEHAPEQAVAWLTCGPPAPPPEAPQHLVWYQMPPTLFREVDLLGAGPPLLLVRTPDIATWDDEFWPDGCTVFVPFQDPENVGTLIRSAAAFGVASVVLLEEAAHPFHPKSVRAAGGSALYRMPLFRGPSIHDLWPKQQPLLCLSPEGRDVATFTFPPTFGLLPGLEGPGLPQSLRSQDTLRIPMSQAQESLNAATATGIVLYLWSTRA